MIFAIYVSVSASSGAGVRTCNLAVVSPIMPMLKYLLDHTSRVYMTCLMTLINSDGGGIGLLSPKSYVDVPETRACRTLKNLTFGIPIFCRINHPSNIPFSIEKHPIFPKLGAFYHNLLKIHPIFQFGLLRLLLENPPIGIQNFAKKRPKRQAHITYTMSM